MSVPATTVDYMPDSVEPTPVSYTPSEASNLALAAAGLAGLSVSDSMRDMLAQLDSGEITAEQAIAEVKAHYTEPWRSSRFPRILSGACCAELQEVSPRPGRTTVALGLRGFLETPWSDVASGRDGGLDEFAPLAAFGPAPSDRIGYGQQRLGV